MEVDTITKFENSIALAKAEYNDEARKTLQLIEDGPTQGQIRDQVTSLHIKAVALFNLFERSIDEYGLAEYGLNEDVKNRKIEDALVITDLIVNYWKLVRNIASEFNIDAPQPSAAAYASTQRLLKCFKKNEIQRIRQKYMAANLPTNGFDDSAKHSGWKIGSWQLTTSQVVIGLIFITGSAYLIYHTDHMNGMQYMLNRVLLSFGVALVGTALMEGTIDLKWTISKSLTIKAIGWIAVFILLYFLNPPSAPTP